MSRKHYKLIANAIATLPLDQFTKSTKKQQYIAAKIAQHISNSLRGTNPRYDSARFYRACLHR